MRDNDNKDCSVIGEDLIVNGDIKCKSDLMIEGRVGGNVSCKTLFVGKNGTITGDITTENVIVEGTIHGMIASGSVELKNGCKLEGNISSMTLAIDHGAMFTGSVHPKRDAGELGIDAGKPGIKEAAE